MKEIEGHSVLTSELLTMGGQTESPANPKRKEKKKKEKEEIRMLLTMARIGIETKGKRRKGEKRALKGEKLGSAAAH